MRKLVLSIFLFVLALVQVQSQLVVDFKSGNNANPGDTIRVDLRVTDFDNLLTTQFSINWDSLVLKFAKIENVYQNLPGFDENSIGVPPGLDIRPGQMTVSWFNGNGATVPDSTVLFTIALTGLNVPCDSTELVISGVPRKIEVIDFNFNDIGISFTPKKIKINGPDCGGGGGGPTDDKLTFTFPTRNVQNGTEVCFPLTVTNFNGFDGGQGRFEWDPAVLSFSKIQNAKPLLTDNQGNVGDGRYNFIWENLDPSSPVSIPDGDFLFEVCFNVVGSTGSMTPIDMTKYMNDWFFTDSTGNDPPLTLKNGKATVVDVVPDPVILNIGNFNVDEGGSACAAITVENFENMSSIQGTFTWNNSVINFKETSGFGALANSSAGDFNMQSSNTLRYTWNAPGGLPNGATLADNTKIFDICFNGVGNCTNRPSSLVDMIDVTNFNIEFVQIVGGTPTPVAYEVNSGTASINACAGNCSITSSKDVSCNGGSDGNIIVNVMPSSAGCECKWYKDGSTTPISSTPATNCNLQNITAGFYRLEVSCNGTVECTDTVTVRQPNTININGQVNNIGCSNTVGSIVLSVSGGNQGYTYRWDDPAMSTTKDISNLTARTYNVTVTDSKGCTATRMFTITDVVVDLAFTETVTNVNCFGDATGAIVLNITGGCPNGSGQYNVSPASLTNLTAGSYTITVTDFATPPNMVTKTINVSGPSSALTLTGTTTPSTGTDGSISTMVTGGTPNYGIMWTGGITAGNFNPTGLAPDSYTATVTDANGCTVSQVFVVRDTMIGGGNTPTSLGAFTSSNTSCNGLADGAIFGSISGGDAPFKVDLLRAGNVVSTKNIATTTNFNFTGLQAGSYTVRVTGNTGLVATSTQPINISQPTAIDVDTDIDCANGSNDDGSIRLDVSGGNGNYMYEWNTGDTTQNLTGVGLGNYSVLIEDANGCQAILNNLRIDDCNPTNCYEAITMITPNGDGINDEFVINCVMQETTQLTVFDRWGNEVFTASNYDNTWSGTDLDGEQLREGGYMWILEVDFNDNRKEIFKGTLTILREN